MNTAKKDLGPQFLYADDLLRDGRWIEAKLVIASHIPANTLRGADNSPVEKDAIGFEKTDKLLVLNRTNTRLIRIATGNSKPDGWIGKSIVVYPVRINAFGESNLAAIRVRAGDGKPVPKGVRKFMGVDLTTETRNDQ